MVCDRTSDIGAEDTATPRDTNSDDLERIAKIQLDQKIGFKTNPAVTRVISGPSLTSITTIQLPVAPLDSRSGNRNGVPMTVKDVAAMISDDRTSRYLTRGGVNSTCAKVSVEAQIGAENEHEETMKEKELRLLRQQEAPVFTTNLKLLEMSQKFGPSLSNSTATGTATSAMQYTRKEIDRALGTVMRTQKRQPCLINPSQISALVLSILRPLSLIQGPPGTGKTFTACALLSTLSVLRHQRLQDGGDLSKGYKNHRILACAHSNVATDNLLSGMIEMGVANVVRLGRPVNVKSNLWNYTLDALLQKEPDWLTAKQRLDEAFEDYHEITGPPNGNRASRRGNQTHNSADEEEVKFLKDRITSAKKRLERIEASCIFEILNSADCIISTCIGSGAETLKTFVQDKGIKFKTGTVDKGLFLE